MPGLVEELGGREVVGGEHRDPLAVGVQPGDVDDGQAADRCRRWRSCWLRRALRARLRQSARRASRASSARGDEVEEAVRDLALGQQRPGLRRPVGGEDRDPVRVGAEARARLRRRRSRRAGRRPCGGASRRPARASRSPRRSRRGPGRRVAWRLARRRHRGRGDPGDLGQEVRRRLELEGQPVAAGELGLGGATGRKSATAAAMTRASKRAPGRPDRR